jgi:glycosyltransferase involved in cell wall biosynthesis
MKSWFFDRSHKMFLDKWNRYRKIRNLAVIGVSDWITNEVKCSPLFSSSTIIQRIYNWVDLNTFHDVGRDVLLKLDLSDKFIILGVASSWTLDKGINDFIYIANHVQADCQVLLVGNVEESVNLPTNIICVGNMTGASDLASYYSAADVFVSPSVQETFGKVVAEAIACGTPACVYNSTALPELVEGGCGEIVEPGDQAGLVTAIQRIRENGKTFYSVNCIKKAKNSFDLHENVRQHIEVYHQLIQNNSNPSNS